LADAPWFFWQLDNEAIVDLSIAVAPQNFFSVSGYTFIFFDGIVALVHCLQALNEWQTTMIGHFAIMCRTVWRHRLKVMECVSTMLSNAAVTAGLDHASWNLRCLT
jgi:hypothetical protein